MSVLSRNLPTKNTMNLPTNLKKKINYRQIYQRILKNIYYRRILSQHGQSLKQEF